MQRYQPRALTQADGGGSQMGIGPTKADLPFILGLAALGAAGGYVVEDLDVRSAPLSRVADTPLEGAALGAVAGAAGAVAIIVGARYLAAKAVEEVFGKSEL